MNQTAFMKVDKATFYEFVQKHDDQRFEYEDGYIVQQMTGGTRAHSRVAMQLAITVNKQLEGSDWIALLDRGVECPNTIRYPDMVVEPANEPERSLSTTRPSFIVEVLSSSSLARDLRSKPAEYFTLPALRAYAVFSQFEPACQVWLRQPDGGFPTEPAAIEGLDGIITLPELSVTIVLADVYRGIELPKKDP